jgi:hypothetical protein
MKSVIELGLALCAFGIKSSAQVGIYNASINQAHRAVNATEAASNQNPDGEPPSQGGAQGQAPKPMDPVLAATMQNIASLAADLGKLDPNTPPPASMTNDLVSAANGNKPSAATIGKLIVDLQASVGGKASMRPSLRKLAQYLHALSNGAHLTPAQFQMISDNVEQILDNGGASYESTTGVLNDIKLLARETK